MALTARLTFPEVTYFVLLVPSNTKVVRAEYATYHWHSFAVTEPPCQVKPGHATHLWFCTLIWKVSYRSLPPGSLRCPWWSQ